MRGVQIPLDKSQKLRLERALERLESLSLKANSDASVSVADTIPVNFEDGVLKGHGTSEINGRMVATVCGVVERINKLVYVRSFRARYKPEVGDIIVGRVIEVAPKRWRLEINFSQHAVLMLSSMNLPDGIQRRRTAVDELNMRSIFEENDVICVSPSFSFLFLFPFFLFCGGVKEGRTCYGLHAVASNISCEAEHFGTKPLSLYLAEVRGFQHDGLHLQARSQKYGKLERGQLLCISPYLVKRRKQHFHHLVQYGVDLILGVNGFIWIGEHVTTKDEMVVDQIDKSEEQSANLEGSETYEQGKRHTPLEIRQYICRVANAVRVLSNLDFMVTVEVITDIVDLSISQNHEIHDMLGAEFYVLVAEKEVQRRLSTKKR